MKRYIYTATKQNSNLQASQQINRVGRYIYNHLIGAFKYRKSGNTFDVYVTFLFQKPNDDVQEVTLDINITTYQNKLRMNIIEMTPMERTLGFDLFKPESLINLDEAYSVIYRKIITRVSKAYADYQILI